MERVAADLRDARIHVDEQLVCKSDLPPHGTG